LIWCRVTLFPLGLPARRICDLVESVAKLRQQIQQLADVQVEATHMA